MRVLIAATPATSNGKEGTEIRGRILSGSLKSNPTPSGEKIVERDTSGKIKAGLAKLVEILGDHCEGILSDYDHGRPMNKNRVQSVRELLSVLRYFTPVQCASVIAGMYLYLEENPHRFASDRGFTFELVRKFRSMTDANIGLYEDGDSGRVRRAYKEIPPRTIDQPGVILIDGFNTFVALVRLNERKKAQREKEVRLLLEEGFSGMSKE